MTSDSRSFAKSRGPDPWVPDPTCPECGMRCSLEPGSDHWWRCDARCAKGTLVPWHPWEVGIAPVPDGVPDWYNMRDEWDGGPDV